MKATSFSIFLLDYTQILLFNVTLKATYLLTYLLTELSPS
jgi:hypothetical protein